MNQISDYEALALNSFAFSWRRSWLAIMAALILLVATQPQTYAITINIDVLQRRRSGAAR